MVISTLKWSKETKCTSQKFTTSTQYKTSYPSKSKLTTLMKTKTPSVHSLKSKSNTAPNITNLITSNLQDFTLKNNSCFNSAWPNFQIKSHGNILTVNRTTLVTSKPKSIPEKNIKLKLQFRMKMSSTTEPAVSSICALNQKGISLPKSPLNLGKNL